MLSGDDFSVCARAAHKSANCNCTVGVLFCGRLSFGIASYCLFIPTLLLIWASRFLYCICIRFEPVIVFSAVCDMNFPLGKKSCKVSMCAESGSP